MTLDDLPAAARVVVETLVADMEGRGISSSDDACYPVSKTLARDLEAHGFHPIVYKLAGCRADLSRIHERWTDLMTLLKKDQSILVHFVVRLDDAVIDLTYQQFDCDAAAIRVTTITDLKRDWTEIEAVF